MVRWLLVINYVEVYYISPESDISLIVNRSFERFLVPLNVQPKSNSTYNIEMFKF